MIHILLNTYANQVCLPQSISGNLINWTNVETATVPGDRIDWDSATIPGNKIDFATVTDATVPGNKINFDASGTTLPGYNINWDSATIPGNKIDFEKTTLPGDKVTDASITLSKLSASLQQTLTKLINYYCNDSNNLLDSICTPF